MPNAARAMFMELWGKEMKGHPRYYELLLEIAELHSNKHQDYGREDDPFANFTRAKRMNIPPSVAAVLRMADKWSRIETFMSCKQYAVKEETFEDTLLDMAVLSLITLILYEEERNAHPQTDATPSATRDGLTDRGRTSDELSEDYNKAFQEGSQPKGTQLTD